ncbi:MAG: hypothetical protein K9M75_07090 [Phycisphaerae bacterium]|nr:hypothetical protein [Phycisphaerae bacterium]
MRVKKIISLLAGIAFIAVFAACPAFAASGESSGTYVAPPKDHNLITGTLDYLGSVVEVTTKGTMEALGAAMSLPETALGSTPARCQKPVTYRPVQSMNRGSRWTRSYSR